MKVALAKIPQRTTNRDNKTVGILNWDIDNAYPQRMQMMRDNSGRATVCCEKYARFIEGDGFIDPLLADLVINDDVETANDLLSANAEDYSLLRGFAIHVNWNANFKIDSLYCVPFETTRLTTEDSLEYVGKIAVHKDWARLDRKTKSISKESITFIDVFNPDPVVILSQVTKAGGWDKYKGQVAWFGAKLKRKYPVASIDPVLEDVDSDSQSKVFKNNNIRNNFIPSGILVKKGKSESEDLLQEEADKLAAFQGAEKGGKLMLVEVETEEEVPKFIDFKQADIDKLYSYTEQSVKDSIRQRMEIPPVLVGDLVAGKLGTAQEIVDATKFYNAVTQKERNAFSRIWAQLLLYWKNPIPFKEPINVSTEIKKLILVEASAQQIQVELLKDLTKNERRALLNYPEQDATKADETLLAETLGVGGTQSMVAILEGTLEPQQKINTLVLLFGLNEAEAEALVNGTPLPSKEIVAPAAAATDA